MLCLHNIADPHDRKRALDEIVRALAPGGVAIVSDLAGTEEYANVFRAAGLEVSTTGLYLDTFPFQRIVEARKAPAREPGE